MVVIEGHIMIAAEVQIALVSTPGAEFFFGRSLNRFLEFYDNHYKRILDEQTGREFNINVVAHSVVDVLSKHQSTDPALSSFYHYDPTRCLAETLGSLDHYLMFVRESVFEEVRESSFPHLPSRHRCIWLIPNNLNALKYWRSLLGGKQQVYQVRVTGKIHKASQEYLSLGTYSLNQLRQRAFRYWSGARNADAEQDEILCEGFVKVVDAINHQAAAS